MTPQNPDPAQAVSPSKGPLAGVRVVEFAGLGPAPMAAMLLADMGAEVLRIERTQQPRPDDFQIFDPAKDILNRSRRILRLDLKNPAGLETARSLISRSDMLIEGFRPGVMERLGLGPDELLALQPALVYGRMTGWGQYGPLSQTAGHDINYLALSGTLHAIGEPGGKPVVPLNVVADGGGAMMLAMGMLAALTAARSNGQGQVVDAAMTDCSALLASMIHTLKAMGQWNNERGSNLLDGGAHFYGTYRCADGKFLAVGPIEPPFHRHFLQLAGLEPGEFEPQFDRNNWPELRTRLAMHLSTRSRDEWCALFAGSDACVAPVLDLDEAPHHPHNQARNTFTTLNGVTQPAPAPRFSRDGCRAPSMPDKDSHQTLLDWGFSHADIVTLMSKGVST